MKFSLSKNQWNIFHLSFEIALILKAINGVLEVIGGVLFLFLDPASLNRIVVILTQGELSEDPNDLIANTLLHMAQGFSISTQHFGVFYLISHGIIKLIIIMLLWKKKLWAYPLGVIVLVLFILYQLYRYFISPSFFLIFLTVLDLILIMLTIIEYKRQKQLLMNIR